MTPLSASIGMAFGWREVTIGYIKMIRSTVCIYILVMERGIGQHGKSLALDGRPVPMRWIGSSMEIRY